MFAQIDHVGVAVDDLDAAIALHERAYGLTLAHREVVEEQGVEAVLLDVGASHVELLRPLAPDTAVGRFLASRGAGLHHVAYRVADIEAALDTLRDRGLQLIDGLMDTVNVDRTAEGTVVRMHRRLRTGEGT